MARKRFQQIAHLVGTGRVFEREDRLADVHYDIRIIQEQIEASPGEWIDGLKDIKGTIQPVENPELTMLQLFRREHLILVMSDGHKIDFFITDTRSGRIANRSGIYSSEG